MMKPSTFGFLVVRCVRNLGKHWAMTIACIASLPLLPCRGQRLHVAHVPDHLRYSAWRPWG